MLAQISTYATHNVADSALRVEPIAGAKLFDLVAPFKAASTSFAYQKIGITSKQKRRASGRVPMYINLDPCRLADKFHT